MRPFLLSLFLFALPYFFLPSSVFAADDPCFVCNGGEWKLASGDGTCPKDKAIVECKTDDEASFGGCRGGGASAGGACETKKDGSSTGAGSGRLLFAPEVGASLCPYGQSCDAQSEDKVAGFLNDSSSPYRDSTQNTDSGCTGDFLGDLVRRFKEFLAVLFREGIGTGKTVFLSDEESPKPCGDASSEFDKATDAIRRTLEINPNPLRDRGSDTSYKEISSSSLKDIIDKSANGRCVPGGLIKAISQKEAGAVFNYTDAEVSKFSTTGWQKTATENEKKRGYCYNTCDDPALKCAGSDVMGPMQFERGTWNGLVPEIARALQEDFGVTSPPDRCNLRDSIVAAAVKIKKDSGTGAGQCANWDEPTVRNRVAKNYCGTCDDGPACGVNYCGSVWSLYRAYSSIK